MLYDYKTYDNVFKLDIGLKEITEFVAQKRQGDFNMAKALFIKQNSVEDLMDRPEGHSADYLVLSKSDT